LDGHDVIIGDDWLTAHKAVLDFGMRTIAVGVGKKEYVICDRADETMLPSHPTISAVQADKALRLGCQFYAVKLQEDADSTSGCESPCADHAEMPS